jgi:signal transduction histidine kinase
LIHRSRLSRSGHIATVVGPGALVLALGMLAFDATQRLAGHAGEIARAHEVSTVFQGVLGVLLDAESAVRAYVVTGDDAFLQPHNDAHDKIGRQFTRLQALVRDAEQRRSLDELLPLLDAKLEVGERLIRLRRSGNAAEAQLLVASGAGSDAMDAVRLAMTRIGDRQTAIAAARVSNTHDTAARLAGLIVLAALLAITLAVLANLVLTRHLRRQERLTGELTDSNAQLQDQAIELELQADLLQAQASQLEELACELQESAAHRDELLHSEHEARLAAEEANAAKSAFLAAMSHELRTPLNAIAGYVDLLDLGINGPVTDGQRQALDRVRRNQHYLLELISDILNYAKLEAGRIDFDFAPVAVSELVAALEPLVEPQVRAAGLQYAWDGCDPSILVCGDRERTEQVLLNLIGNSIKFTPPGGRITVSCESDGLLVRICVRDTGRGIPADMAQKIFEPFVQLERSRVERSQQGVGLGLAISRDLAEGMGGTLEVGSPAGEGGTLQVGSPAGEDGTLQVGSPAGEGCTFTLTLPAWDPAVAEHQRHAAAARRAAPLAPFAPAD